MNQERTYTGEQAAFYAAQGWAVFPCYWVEPDGRCGCGKSHEGDENSIGKHPVYEPSLGLVHGHKDASSDVEWVQHVWSTLPKANVAYEPGRHGHLVVDVDPRHDGDRELEDWERFNGLESDGGSVVLPATRTSLTGGGGYHLFYSLDRDVVVPSQNNWLPGVDIKSSGGYVLLPPSSHRSGREYSWDEMAMPIQPAPELFVVELLRRGSASGLSGGAVGWSDDGFSAISTEQILMNGFPEGQRDNGLFRFAMRLRRQLGDDRAEIEKLVVRAAAACRPPFPEYEARRKVARAFRYDMVDRFESAMPWVASLADAPEELPAKVEAAPAGDMYLPDAFWESRPVLRHVRDFARARWVTPDALLGVVFTRVLACVPPHFTLPPIVGGRASLNMFIALVGKSGGGKSVTMSAAEDAVVVDLSAFRVETPGSGEGIAHAYMRRGDIKAGEPPVIQHTASMIFNVSEIDTLVALGSRNGATLMPELRKAWSGEQLGFAYADPTKKLPVPAHMYRMGLIAGVQPGRSKALLDDSDAGTPQRFVWFVTGGDPGAVRQPPPEPPPWVWKNPCTHITPLIPVCERVRTELQDARYETLRNPDKEEGALDGHRGLARLKIAAALAVLDGRLEVADEDWDLAAVVISTSDAVRADVQRHLTVEAQKSAHARAVLAGHSTATADEVASERAILRVVTLLKKHIMSAGETGATAGKLRQKLNRRDRGEIDVALDRLVAAGVVEAVDEAGSVRYRVK